MAVRLVAFTRSDDGKEFIGHAIEHEEKLWLVPAWLTGPTTGTLCPARIICMDGLSLTKAGLESPADYVLATPLNKAALEGRAVGQNLDVRERPDIHFREDQDFHR